MEIASDSSFDFNPNRALETYQQTAIEQIVRKIGKFLLFRHRFDQVYSQKFTGQNYIGSADFPGWRGNYHEYSDIFAT